MKWLGADPKNRQLQSVEVRGKKGFVLRSALTDQRELGPGGAATAGGAEKETAAREALRHAEALNTAAATPEALEKKRRELNP